MPVKWILLNIRLQDFEYRIWNCCVSMYYISSYYKHCVSTQVWVDILVFKKQNWCQLAFWSRSPIKEKNMSSLLPSWKQLFELKLALPIRSQGIILIKHDSITYLSNAHLSLGPFQRFIAALFTGQVWKSSNFYAINGLFFTVIAICILTDKKKWMLSVW